MYRTLWLLLVSTTTVILLSLLVSTYYGTFMKVNAVQLLQYLFIIVTEVHLLTWFYYCHWCTVNTVHLWLLLVSSTTVPSGLLLVFSYHHAFMIVIGVQVFSYWHAFVAVAGVKLLLCLHGSIRASSTSNLFWLLIVLIFYS